MCSIVGYIGQKNTTDILLNGLKELEYNSEEYINDIKGVK